MKRSEILRELKKKKKEKADLNKNHIDKFQVAIKFTDFIIGGLKNKHH
jgi:hypothetical protein